MTIEAISKTRTKDHNKHGHGLPGLNRIILRKKQVLAAIGLGNSKFYEMIAAGEFPQPVRLGPNSVGWYSDVVQEWIDARPVVNLEV